MNRVFPANEPTESLQRAASKLPLKRQIAAAIAHKAESKLAAGQINSLAQLARRQPHVVLGVLSYWLHHGPAAK